MHFLPVRRSDFHLGRMEACCRAPASAPAAAPGTAANGTRSSCSGHRCAQRRVTAWHCAHASRGRPAPWLFGVHRSAAQTAAALALRPGSRTQHSSARPMRVLDVRKRGLLARLCACAWHRFLRMCASGSPLTARGTAQFGLDRSPIRLRPVQGRILEHQKSAEALNLQPYRHNHALSA
jgi:hypothetical protein